LDLGAKAR